MWNHVKTVQTEEEGAEVAALMGDSPVILLRGHGATSAGSSLEDAVMTMMQLEEQAKMNYWATPAPGRTTRTSRTNWATRCPGARRCRNCRTSRRCSHLAGVPGSAASGSTTRASSPTTRTRSRRIKQAIAEGTDAAHPAPTSPLLA